MEGLSLNSLPETEGVKKFTPLFINETCNTWLKMAEQQAIPLKLFDTFFHESELSILFSDTNMGKSILAVQIGQSIASGQRIPGFRMEGTGQPVLYFDFELSAKQFEARYSEEFKNHFHFSDNLFRTELNPEAVTPEEFSSFDEYLNVSLETSIQQTGAKVLIIDNLTFLKSDTEKAKDALPLMKELKRLKSKYGLSILALAHTPKRDLSKPITRNDLAGSKMLINFCDSAFTIGESAKDGSLRYIKQIKARATEISYGGDNVITCQISKPSNFLQFEFLGFARESEHLKESTEKDRESIIEQAKELSQQGKSQRQISTELGISVGAVNKYLKK